MQTILEWLARLHTRLTREIHCRCGADLGPLGASRVPLVLVHPDGTHYFDIHHSAADTFDKIDPENLAKNAAAIAVVAWALAEMPQTLPRPPGPERQEAPRPAAHQ